MKTTSPALTPLLAIFCWAALLSAQGQTNYQLLLSLQGNSGTNPRCALIEGNDGSLVGTTYGGGRNNLGTLFRLNKDGSGFTVVHDFGDGPQDASQPYCGLLKASDGALYGTATRGGSSDAGALFRLNQDGSAYSTLYSFSTTDQTLGAYGPLMQGSDGLLYGTSAYGGANQWGSIFRVDTNGSTFAVLHVFGSVQGDGQNPFSGLTEGPDGVLYGTTVWGGANGWGALFKLNKDGTAYSVIYSFSPYSGSFGYGGVNPYGQLVQGSDGMLYGTTQGGGNYNGGVAFRIGRNGAGYTVLHHFGGAMGSDWDGKGPFRGLTEAKDGLLYGTTSAGGNYTVGAVFRMAKDGSGYSVLHRFGLNVDGNNPYEGLLFASDGSLYGTTAKGGTKYAGSVFRLFSSPARISAAPVKVDTAGALLSFSGGAQGQTYQIQTRSNLLGGDNWQVIGSAISGYDGTFQFRDTSATNYPARFYRTVFQQ